MPSTYSSRLRLELMASGENPGTWGTITNTNLGTLLESSIAGRAAVSMTDADYTLTAVNGSADEARNMILNISGALTATRNVICPTSSKLYFVKNATTGGQSIVLKTSSGSGVTVANGATAAVFCDGTNVVDAVNQFRGVDGAATTPPLSFASESTLGFYRASAGVLAASGPLQLPANAASALHAVPLQQLTGYQPTFRNKIINGDFSVWQRGTSQTSAGYGSADRWNNTHSGSTKTTTREAFTIGQVAVPGEPTYFMRTVVSSVAGAGNYVVSQQRIEGVRTFAGSNIRISFWAKADASRPIAIDFLQRFGTTGSPSAEVAGIGAQKFNLTTSWQKFTATVAVPSISGKVITTNDYLELTFWFDAGANYNSRTNSLGQQSGTFDIVRVQVEEGTVDTAFEVRPPGVELPLCQRYFYRLNGGAVLYAACGVVENATTTVLISWPLPVTMRAPPTTTYFGTVEVYDGVNVRSILSISSISTTADRVSEQYTVGAGFVAGRAAVLLVRGSSGIDNSAEL